MKPEKNEELTDDEKWERILSTARYTDTPPEIFTRRKCADCGEIFGTLGFCMQCPYCKSLSWCGGTAALEKEGS